MDPSMEDREKTRMDSRQKANLEGGSKGDKSPRLEVCTSASLEESVEASLGEDLGANTSRGAPPWLGLRGAIWPRPGLPNAGYVQDIWTKDSSGTFYYCHKMNVL